MVVDAEFEEIPREDVPMSEQELNLTADESLPWLESDEDDTAAGGIDSIQVMTLLAVLLAIAAAIILAVWYFTKGSSDAAPEPDGSTIEAPDGPIKERPENPGGKEFEGTGNLAPAVGEGEVRDAQIAEGEGANAAGAASGSEAGSGADAAPRPSVDTQTTQAAAAGSENATSSSNNGGISVQLAAYGNRARAEQGWRELSRSSGALSGKNYRIVEANVAIGKVYRLQVPASSRSEANALCDAIKADGLECAVKP
ncbi:MAG: SPOR domain-containing protein [Pseudomonadota bacterium]